MPLDKGLRLREQRPECGGVVGAADVLDNVTPLADVANDLDSNGSRRSFGFSDREVAAHAETIALVRKLRHQKSITP